MGFSSGLAEARSSLQWGRLSDLGSRAAQLADNRSKGEDWRCSSRKLERRVRDVLVLAGGAVDRRGDRNEDDPTEVSGAEEATMPQ